jgi:hypothetical protein
MRSLLAIVTILALGACNKAGGEFKPSADKGANSVAEIAALPEPARNAVFLRAIRDAGLNCQDVVKGEQIKSTGGKATWRAQCEDGTFHLVLVSTDGSAQVVSRTAL